MDFDKIRELKDLMRENSKRRYRVYKNPKVKEIRFLVCLSNLMMLKDLSY